MRTRARRGRGASQLTWNFAALALAAFLLIAGCDVRGKTLYEDAEARMAAGDYEAARVLFNEIPDYRDAAELIAVCDERIAAARQEAAYAAARSLEDGGDYAAAAKAYAALADYGDSAARETACRAAYAEQAAADAAARVMAFSTAEDWDTGLDAAVKALDDCYGSEKAEHFADALRLLAAGDGLGAAERITRAKEENLAALTDDEWAAALCSLLAVRLDDESAALSIAAALRLYEPILSAEEAAKAAPLHVPDEKLMEHAGANPEGKALIYCTRRNYVGEDEAYVDLVRMRMLPKELAATSIDEAAYVITVHYDYKHVKKFTTYYNWGVREYAEITVTNLASGEAEGEPVTILAPSAKSLATAKMASEFVSGGPPDETEINEALESVIEGLVKKLA